MQILVDEHTDRTRGDRSPTLFHLSETGEALLLLADASETAFSRCYQPLIDIIKTTFTDSLLHSDGLLPERLRIASGSIEKTMRARFPSSSEFGEECYSAVFVVLGLQESNVFPLWIGSPQAKLLRDGLCIRTTSPQVTILPNSSRVYTDSSITTSSEAEAPIISDEPWSLMASDMLVLADHRLFSLFSENELVSLIEGTRSNKAKALVEAAQALNFTFAQSAIVAQVL
jgi:hypothetical protein